MKTSSVISASLLVFGVLVVSAIEIPGREQNPMVNDAPPGWQPSAPRDEIRPTFAYEHNGGPDATGCLLIKADAREGLDASCVRVFPVTGGKSYRFSALYQAKSVSLERRSIVTKVDWQYAQGYSVPREQPTVATYRRC